MHKVVTKCHGFRGQLWHVDEEVDIDLSREKPPKHFVPLEALPEAKKREPHRTEAREVKPGESLRIQGGIAASLENTKLPRILTTDRVPHNKTPKEEAAIDKTPDNDAGPVSEVTPSEDNTAKEETTQATENKSPAQTAEDAT